MNMLKEPVYRLITSAQSISFLILKGKPRGGAELCLTKKTLKSRNYFTSIAALVKVTQRKVNHMLSEN
ncbi:MAG: hypothetical protein CFE23_12030 [Flavobacterium sp. BFFFF1]|nr:MAG: hypothetical protein CFE23_12030 [Flavobacterium sp. BFFFF1]